VAKWYGACCAGEREREMGMYGARGSDGPQRHRVEPVTGTGGRCEDIGIPALAAPRPTLLAAFVACVVVAALFAFLLGRRGAYQRTAALTR
jgi:hypothetical protein